MRENLLTLYRYAALSSFIAVLATSSCLRFPANRTSTATSTKEPEYAVVPSIPEDGDKIERKINRLLLARDFDSIDVIAEAARNNKERLRGGYWKLDEIFEAMTLFVADYGGQQVSEEMWKNRLLLLTQWNQERPDSINAKIALASAHVGYGWHIRGGGYIDSVSPQDYVEFRKQIEIAAAILFKAGKLNESPKCPRLMRDLLYIGMVEAWPRDDWDALFEKAVQAEPNYLQHYLVKSESLTPKWNGAAGDWQQFLDSLPGKLSTLGTDETDLIYFVVVANKLNEKTLSVNGGMLSKERLKGGFDLLETRYGADNYRLNQIAFAATFAMDFTTGKRAFERIESRDPDVWSETTFSTMKKLAQTGLPSP